MAFQMFSIGVNDHIYSYFFIHHEYMFHIYVNIYLF